MAKILSKMLALVMSFAMVFSGMLLLDPVSADAATDMSNYTFAAAVVDADGNPVNGVVVKAYLEDMQTPVTTGGYDSSFNWVESPLAITSSDGEVTLSLSKLSAGFENKDLVFVVEDEVYESEDSHTIQVNESANLSKVDGADFDWENPPALSFVVKEKSTEPVSTEWTAADFIFDGATVTGLSDSGKEKVAVNPEMVIPSKNGETEVTAIGASAFKDAAIESVVYPEGLTTIGNLAFNGTRLSKAIIPDTVSTVGAGAYANILTLSEIKLPDNEGFTTITGLFSRQINKDEKYDDLPMVEEVVIPDRVTTIAGNSFAGLGLKKVTLPASLTSLGRTAFTNNRLEEVDIPEGVKKLETGVFSTSVGMWKEPVTLKKVTLHEGLTDIGNNAFMGASLKTLEIPSTVTTLHVNAFQVNTSGVDDGRVLLKVATEEQFAGTTKFKSNGSGHKVSVDVTFDANGGSAVDPATVQTGLGWKLETLPETAKEGAIFAGWFTAAEGGEAVTTDTVFEADTTVYAHWVADETIDDASNKIDEAVKSNEEAKAACDALGEEPTEEAIKNAEEKAEAAAKAAEDAVNAAEAAKEKQAEGSDGAAIADNLVKEAQAASADANSMLTAAKTAAAKAAAAKAADAKAKADEAAKTAGDEAVTAAKDAETAAKEAAAKAEEAAKAATAAAEAAKAAYGEDSDQYKAAAAKATEAQTAKTDADKAASDAADAVKAAEKAKADKDAADAKAAAEAKAKTVTTVTVNTKNVNAAAIDAAVKAAGGSNQYVTKIVLGSKVKKIGASAFKNYKKVTTLEVKTKKLSKKSVKKSLKGSAVKTIKVKISKKASTNKKYVKKYKKFFTKKNAGKKASVKR